MLGSKQQLPAGCIRWQQLTAHPDVSFQLTFLKSRGEHPTSEHHPMMLLLCCRHEAARCHALEHHHCAAAAAALLLHVAAALLTWTPDYCATPLLTAPLATQRQASAAAALELASLPLAVVQPVASVLLPGYVLLEGAGVLKLPKRAGS